MGELGSGGFGAVYLAINVATRKYYAIKFGKNEKADQSIVNEYKNVLIIGDHDSLVKYHDLYRSTEVIQNLDQFALP